MDYRKYISDLVSKSIYPTLKNITEEISSRIEKAIKNKEIPTDITIKNPTDIQPLLEAQNATTEAVKAIPVVNIPELDISGLEGKMGAVLEAIKNQKLVVNQGDTKVNVDMHPFLMAIEKLKQSIPTLAKQEVIDYTLMFDEMMTIMERPKDEKEVIKLQELIKKLGTSEDLFVITEWLKTIAEKPFPKFPELKFNKEGRLEVEVDRAGGGGGGGLSQVESLAIQDVSTEETLRKIAGLNYDTTSVDMSDPNNIVITYLLNSVLVATETAVKTGTTWNIFKT
jgi:hypothetical protein